MGGPWEKYQSMGAAPMAPPPSTALPAAGDPTSFTGAAPGGYTTPGRYDPETLRAFSLDLMANGGKGAAGILQGDPGQQYAKTYANTQAANQGNLDMKQKMTGAMLGTINRFRQLGDEAGDTVLGKAIGPNYGALSADPSSAESWFKAPLPDTSGEFYQNARAGLSRIAGTIPGSGAIGGAVSAITGNGYDPNWVDENVKARNLNLEMQHLVKGIGAGVKAIPGTKNGGTSTDADQALVLDAVGEAMHAGDPETHRNIVYDAQNIIRARANQPPLPPPPGYKMSAWGAQNGAPQVNAGAGAASAAPNVRKYKAVNPATGHTMFSDDGKNWSE